MLEFTKRYSIRCWHSVPGSARDEPFRKLRFLLCMSKRSFGKVRFQAEPGTELITVNSKAVSNGGFNASADCDDLDACGFKSLSPLVRESFIRDESVHRFQWSEMCQG